MKYLFAFLALFLASTASATIRYVSFTNGSNANAGTAKTAPWKSVPGMQTAAGCGGATPNTAIAPGDSVIFEGGDTWPVACFEWTISTGGTSTAQVYYGVDKTWFIGASWTRPLFDMGQNVPTGRHVITVTSAFGGYATFDNFEIANQQVPLQMLNADDAYNFTAVGTAPIPGVLIENGYIHDWISNSNVASFPATCAPGSQLCVWPYSVGAIDDGHDRVTVDHMTVSGANSWVFNGATKVVNGYSGGCVNCGEVKNSTWHDVGAFCYTVTSCHDNEVYNVKQSSYDLCPCRPHSQVIEDDIPNGTDTGGWMKVYNNYIHDVSGAGVVIFVPYNNAIYNNVISNGNNNNILLGQVSGDSSSTRGFIYNNTVDCSNGASCIRGTTNGTYAGVLNLANNIWITNGSPTCFTGGTNQCGKPTTSGVNYTMPTSEAALHGFTAVRKYQPSSTDSNVMNAGANLTTSCNGNLSQLCKDTGGAPWFSGVYTPRPVNTGTGTCGMASGVATPCWTMGAFVFPGAAGNPPTCTITAPSGTISGINNFTESCTPVSPATMSSLQLQIDGFNFGAAGTSSPYTLSWDSRTASNGNHALSGTGLDSNSLTGVAPTVNVTVNNLIPGCFVSNANWSTNLPFASQSGTFTVTFTVTPNTSPQNTIVGLSQAAAAAYGDMPAILHADSTGVWDAWNDAVGGYAAVNSAPYSTGTAYTFQMTPNIGVATYNLSETAPSNIIIASNYTFRSGAPATTLGFVNAQSLDSTPDTAKVCNFALSGASGTLSFSPSTLTFPDTPLTSTSAAISTTGTVSGGSVSMTGVVISGTNAADFAFGTNTCTGTVTSSCATGYTFKPSVVGAESAISTYTDSASNSPQVINLAGNGLPQATVSPAVLNFNSEIIGVTTPQKISTLTNNGGSSLTSIALSYSGDSSMAFVTPSSGTDCRTITSLASGASCNFAMTYLPTALGLVNGNVSIASSMTGSPIVVATSGTGTAPPAPAPQFAFSPTFPITVTMGKKTFTEIYQASCTCTWKFNAPNPPWTCQCN